MPRDTSVETQSDDALLALYAQGDPEAAAVLTARLTPLAYGLAVRLLSDRAEAEDVAQEAMLRLWRAAATWQPGGARVSTWVYRVVSNLATDRLRRRRRDGPPIDAIAEPVSRTPSAAEQIQDRTRLSALQSALESLPDRQKEAVILRHIEGLANPEIAHIMGLSVEAVESLTARGKRRLGQLLAARRAELGYQDDIDTSQ